MNDSVPTPQWIITSIKKEFGDTLYDPVPLNPDFDPRIHKDALTTDWGQVSFVNPPYSKSNVKKFFKKAHEQWKQGKTVVLLCKLSNLSTIYAMEYTKGAEIRIFSRFVSFPGYGGKIPWFHSVLVIWKANQTLDKYSIIETK